MYKAELETVAIKTPTTTTKHTQNNAVGKRVKTIPEVATPARLAL